MTFQLSGIGGNSIGGGTSYKPAAHQSKKHRDIDIGALLINNSAAKNYGTKANIPSIFAHSAKACSGRD